MASRTRDQVGGDREGSLQMLKLEATRDKGCCPELSFISIASLWSVASSQTLALQRLGGGGGFDPHPTDVDG